MSERQSMEHNFLQFKQNSDILLIFYCGEKKKKQQQSIKQQSYIGFIF